MEFVRSISLCYGLINSLHYCMVNLKPLNHCSPPLGILVSAAIVSSVTVRFNIPTFEVVPLKLIANSIETCTWHPCNLWQNHKHPVLLKTSKVVGYSFKKFISDGSYLRQWPPLLVFLFVAMVLVYLLCLT